MTGGDDEDFRGSLESRVNAEYDEAYQQIEEGNKMTETTYDKIRTWANDRNLVRGATPSAQYQKLLEEVGELGRGLIEDNPALVIDSIGDVIVVLTILAAQLGLDVENCVDSAYNEIKDRKGKMVNGIFVKEA